MNQLRRRCHCVKVDVRYLRNHVLDVGGERGWNQLALVDVSYNGLSEALKD